MRTAEFVQSYFDAWNHADPKAVADHLTADGIYRDIPEKVQRSHDELVVSLEDFFDQFRHRYELIGDILKNRDTVAFQYRIYPLSESGLRDASGPYHGAEFMTLHGDAAITIIDYYDTPGMERPSDLARLTADKEQRPKYAKSGLSNEQLLEYKNRLDNIMRSQQVYLRSDLTLPKLAGTIDCSVNHLSQVINSGFEMSFFDYVNQFRIEHAKQLLSELDGQNGAILNIAFTVGFHSNSAFYAAFKKRVGQTPAQFRRNELNKRCEK